MTRMKVSILALSTNFCTIKVSGNTVWSEVSGFQKSRHFIGIFNDFYLFEM